MVIFYKCFYLYTWLESLNLEKNNEANVKFKKAQFAYQLENTSKNNAFLLTVSPFTPFHSQNFFSKVSWWAPHLKLRRTLIQLEKSDKWQILTQSKSFLIIRGIDQRKHGVVGGSPSTTTNER